MVDCQLKPRRAAEARPESVRYVCEPFENKTVQLKVRVFVSVFLSGRYQATEVSSKRNFSDC